MAIQITDPTHAPHVGGPLGSWARRHLFDGRDAVFVRLIALIVLVLLPAALFLYARFSWLAGAAYWGLLFGVFVDRYILMAHNVAHRPLFKTLRGLNYAVPVVVAPLFGHTPFTYIAHHIGMHHPENNLEEDLSSTMKYQRDNAFHFLLYFARFFFLTLYELPTYLWRKNRRRLALKALFGELSWYALVGLLLAVNWRATMVVLIIPFVVVRFLMMLGNWGQHAFVDASAPENPYLNSITCINARYNRRAFNDGYHIGHHLKANRHWTDLPVEFANNLHEYAQHDAIVFRGIDFFLVSVLLLTRQYRLLARCYVQLGPRERTQGEIIALFRRRVQPLVRAPATVLHPSGAS